LADQASRLRKGIILKLPVQDTAWPLGESVSVGSVVAVLQKLYGVSLVVLSLAIATLLALKGASHYPTEKWVYIGLGLEVLAFSYWGLRSRKPWVLPLVLFGSAYAIIPCLADRPRTLTGVVLGLAVVAFSLYQLWFFTRPATRDFFGADSPPVF
jgi:hypothetical protein